MSPNDYKNRFAFSEKAGVPSRGSLEHTLRTAMAEDW